MATIGGDQASRQWCREHGLITNAMGENNDLLGGVLVIPQFESAIINLKETFGVFGQYVRNVPMTSDQWIGPRRLSGLTAYAVTEAQQITDSDATMNQVSLTAKKWGTLTRISSELSEDAIIAVADFLANEIAYAHAVKEDQAGFLGDGTTTHNGIVGLANALLAGSVSTAAGGQNTAAALTIAGRSPGLAYARHFSTLKGSMKTRPTRPQACWASSSHGDLSSNRCGVPANGSGRFR
jgi:HK97 family phage major capsid protein